MADERDLSYPKNLYRAMLLDGVVTVYYDDHGETKIHPQCICEVRTAEGEKHVKGEGWFNTPQDAYNAVAATVRAAEIKILESKLVELKQGKGGLRDAQ